MKIKNEQSNTFTYANILIFIVILSIPFYFLRVLFNDISISILTCNLIVLSLILLILHYKNINQSFRKEKILWFFSALFILSFIPVLVLYPTVHGFGVFIEWISIPIICGFLLFVHILRSPVAQLWIHNAFLTLVFCVSAIALIYFFSGHITFDGRLHAFFLSPNHLAMFIAPLIFIIVAHVKTTTNLFIKTFLFITILLALVILFFTYSFSTFVALLFSCFLITFLTIKRKILLLFIITLIITSTFFVGYQKILHSNPNWQRNSLQSRVMIWDSAIYHIQKNTLVGIGIDNFQQEYLSTQPCFTPYLEWAVPTPHNLLFTLWLSGGFISILFFCLLCARYIYTTLCTYHNTKNTATIFYLAAFCTILFSGLIDTPYWKNDLSIVFWIIIALGISNERSIPSNQLPKQVKE